MLSGQSAIETTDFEVFWFKTYCTLFRIANEYNFGARWPTGRGRRFFLRTNKTFEGICLALAGRFLQKELWIRFVIKIILYKLNIIKFSFELIYEQVN